MSCRGGVKNRKESKTRKKNPVFPEHSICFITELSHSPKLNPYMCSEVSNYCKVTFVIVKISASDHVTQISDCMDPKRFKVSVSIFQYTHANH